MTRPTTWQPLLDAALAARARRVLDEIAVALRQEPDDDDPSLGSGYLGPALYLGYLDGFDRGQGHAAHGEALRDRAIDELASGSLPAGLYPGLTGIAWAVEHLQGDLDVAADDDPNVEIDEALLAFVDGAAPGGDYDLLRGFAGIGVYALERARRPSGRQLLARVVERLRELAEPRGPGVAWRTPPENMWSVERAAYPAGYYNLGVAHGVPPVALVLAAASAVEVSDARELLDGAMRWILAQRRDADSPFVFPALEVCGGPALPSRAAWCYGDPGVAVTLLATARAVGNAEWEQAALAAATRAAARPHESCGVKDAGVCHGAAGLALLFHRLWHATGDACFADAARRWYAHTLELHRPGEGTGGYFAWETPDGDETKRELRPNRSLLCGAAGIGLVLLAGLGVEPRWDRMLAASLPPWAAAS